ncbi:MAG: DUF2189 domain-containing protein [Novosphingobium sp.]|nr:DUF2189 domain-containing protein [Novosphingobium sp.]
MVASSQGGFLPVAIADDLRISDLTAALRAGLGDFLARPQFGLFFAAIYVFAGLFLTHALFSWGEAGWLIPAAAGFPLVAPFVAVGLYEVSRRREAGLPTDWLKVLGAFRGHGDEQLLMMGGFVFVAFSFWIIVAHSIFAIFMAESGLGGESLAVFATPAGMAMLAVGSFVGGLMALGFFAVTVISLPMLVDREVDFLTAIIASLATMRANPGVMIAWAFVIAIVLTVAMVPLFLGLFVALPVLGHATWHLYRRVASPLD